jgi:hypothetical protein
LLNNNGTDASSLSLDQMDFVLGLLGEAESRLGNFTDAEKLF